MLVQKQKNKLICNNEAIVNSVNKLKRGKMTLKQHYAPNADTIRDIKD
jgi:hypothetical protein